MTGAFRDIKAQMNTPAVRQVLALCQFDPSPAGIDKKLAACSGDDYRFYGWVEDGEVLGICCFVNHGSHVEILTIAVDEHAQRRGVGGAMVSALTRQYGLPLLAETDDGAVDFYRKRGFAASVEEEKTKLYGIRRWRCEKGAKKVKGA